MRVSGFADVRASSMFTSPSSPSWLLFEDSDALLD